MGREARREGGEVTVAYSKRCAYCPSCSRCGKRFAGYIFLLDHLHAKHKQEGFKRKF